MNQVLFRNLDEVKKNLDLNTKKFYFLPQRDILRGEVLISYNLLLVQRKY